MNIQKQLGKQLPELQNLVELPPSCYQTWYWFVELHSARSNNGFSANPISYLEMQAYFNLKKIEPMDYELALIKRFDNAYLKVQADKASKEEAKNKNKK